MGLAQSLILPEPDPKINYKSSKYRGIFKKPEVMRRYMLDFADEYVRLYMRELFQKNPGLDKEIFPSVEKLIKDNQRIVRGLPPGYIMEFSKRAAELQKDQMDKMIQTYITTDMLKIVDKKIKLLDDELDPIRAFVDDLEARVKNLEVLGGVSGSSKRQLPQNRNMQKEIVKLADQVKRLKNMVVTKQKPATISTTSQSQTQSWIAWAALGIALLSLLLGFSKKS